MGEKCLTQYHTSYECCLPSKIKTLIQFSYLSNLELVNTQTLDIHRKPPPPEDT